MHYCASVMPPGKEAVGPLSEYLHQQANDTSLEEPVRAGALASWKALRKSVRAGPRKTAPSVEEVEACRDRKRLKGIAFFLDDTFEEVSYDLSTTVGEAVELIAGCIRLQNYNTFGLFDYRKAVVTSKATEPVLGEERKKKGVEYGVSGLVQGYG